MVDGEAIVKVVVRMCGVGDDVRASRELVRGLILGKTGQGGSGGRGPIQ